jgi:hypothetical protein
LQFCDHYSQLLKPLRMAVFLQDSPIQSQQSKSSLPL